GRRNGRRQCGVEYAFDAKAQMCDISSQWVDDGGNAGICCTNDRQALLDGAQPRLLQMLIGTGRNSKPAIIGQVDDPARTIVMRGNGIWKNRLIADQRQRAWRAGNLHRTPKRARDESALNLGELLQAEPFHPVLEWQVFA